MRRIALLVVMLAALVAAATGSAGVGTGITATPASTHTFDGGNTQAKFVRSASGIINETNRVGLNGTAQNPWTSLDVWLQFRPTSNPTGGVVPNPACESNTVIAPFLFSTSEPSIAGTLTGGYFLPTVSYNVCVYLTHTYALDLSVSPNPVIQGHDVVFTSHLLVDGAASATPAATISVVAYHTDSTCTTPAGYGPFSTTQNGTAYTTVPLNASAAPGTYYYKATTTFGAVTLWSACTPLVISPHDYTLTIRADGQSALDAVDVGHHVIYTGTAMDGPYPVSGASVSFDVWNGTGCSGSPLYSGIPGPTTDGSGNYTFDGGPAPAGVYSVKAHTSNATSGCVDVTVGKTATVNDVTSSPSAWDCATGATGGTPTGSTVYWYRNQVTGTVTAKVTLVGALASSTFDVWIEQNPGTCPPGTSTPSNPGGISTDGSGNGSATFTFTPAAGATNFWLSLWTPAGSLTGTQVLRSVAVAP